MMWVFQGIGWISIALLIAFTILLHRRIRYACARVRYLSSKDCCKEEIAKLYETHLHSLIIFRQILLFLLPTAVLMVLPIPPSIKLGQLFSSFVLGLSILIVVSIQLPLLMKAHLLITFNIYDGEWGLGINVKAGKTTYIEAAIRNLGYSTYKNSTVIFYFGQDFDIIPYNNPLYTDKRVLDFKKKFTVQKRHGGVAFNPKDNFMTIAPQEVFIFPMWVKVPNKVAERKMKILFYSENTWGMNEILKQMIITR